MNRRDFLHPRQLATSAGQLLGALQESQITSNATSTDDVALLRMARQAMATTFEVLVPFGTPCAMEAAQETLDLIDRLEQQLTVYRESSEVSALNRRAAGESVVVEERLFHLLELADRLTRSTGGAYDITTGALSKAWGFFRRRGRVPSDAERHDVLERTGMHHVQLDAPARSIRFQTPGLEINLGSIGKGYALDRAAEHLRQQWEISAALLHGGQSSVYAIGSAPMDNRGWLVGIRHPWEQGRRFATARLCDRGLATSAATFQHLEYDGRKLGHILDPRTGWPAEGMASVTVIAPSAAEADALSTAFFILGVEGAREYCGTHPNVCALLLPADVNAEPVTLGTNAGLFALTNTPE